MTNLEHYGGLHRLQTKILHMINDPYGYNITHVLEIYYIPQHSASKELIKLRSILLKKSLDNGYFEDVFHAWLNAEYVEDDMPKVKPNIGPRKSKDNMDYDMALASWFDDIL